MFELDSNPDVHRYLGNSPFTTLQQSIDTVAHIKKQYSEFGIDRWAVIEKATGHFVGWSGLKFITDTINNQTLFYDIGYRLNKRDWGKGYATESATAALNYGFNELKLTQIFGMAQIENVASNQVLQKIGLKFVSTFEHAGLPHNWYEVSAKDVKIG